MSTQAMSPNPKANETVEWRAAWAAVDRVESWLQRQARTPQPHPGVGRAIDAVLTLRAALVALTIPPAGPEQPE